MVHHEVYRHPLYRSYHASVCSKATFFQLITTAVIIVCPLLIAYRSHGLWLKTQTYKEQPDVHFSQRFILQAHYTSQVTGSDANQGQPSAGTLLWSTYPVLNQLAGSKGRLGSVKTHSVDPNHDGRTDSFMMEVTLPLQPSERVTSVDLLTFFNIRLSGLVRFQTAGLIYTHISAPIGSDQFGLAQVVGDLTMVQRAPLPFKEARNMLAYEPLVNASSFDSREYMVDQILARDSARNASSRFANVYQTTGGGDGQSLRIQLTLHVPMQTVEYWTGFWELIKWAWIQYLAMLVVVWFVVSRAREFVFTNFLVNTVPKLDPHLLQTLANDKGLELHPLG